MAIGPVPVVAWGCRSLARRPGISSAPRSPSSDGAGLPENADRGNVRVELNGRRQRTDFVGAADANGLRQVNVLAGEGLRPGRLQVVARFGGVASAPVEIEATLP